MSAAVVPAEVGEEHATESAWRLSHEVGEVELEVVEQACGPALYLAAYGDGDAAESFVGCPLDEARARLVHQRLGEAIAAAWPAREAA